ncbi:hypothetical protein F511_38943 [Dorcoceras hygrometricum]|uniref:Ribonuclease H1 N-terminal domain-containing protein n=1 Tax=Dorcoceras hygrometricum TaxID=472368 RepID=A0A2Z7BL53_9LAMI|nr:hypothetical protein F511_38943 [Dorcoceras hygrometricum]
MVFYVLEPKSYVVFIVRQPGVYDKWSEATEQVCDFRGVCYKGYDTNKEAEEAFSCNMEAMDATRVHKKCESVEIHDHAARMEKVVEEIGQIFEDMAVSDDDYWFTTGNAMPISLVEEEQVKAFHDAGRQLLENSLEIFIPALGHAKSLALWLMVKGYTDPSTYTPDPSSVERAHGSSAAHSPFFWGPSLLS